MFLLAIVVVPTPNVQAGKIENGDFQIPGANPEPFASWSTLPVFDRPTNAGGVAEFATVNLLEDIQLEQTFDLTNDKLLLTIELELSSSPGGTTNPIAADDSFQITLYDAAFDPINPIGPLLPAYYSIDARISITSSVGTRTSSIWS